MAVIRKPQGIPSLAASGWTAERLLQYYLTPTKAVGALWRPRVVRTCSNKLPNTQTYRLVETQLTPEAPSVHSQWTPFSPPPEALLISPPAQVHRLDSATGGLLCCAKTRPALSNLSRAFAGRQPARQAGCDAIVTLHRSVTTGVISDRVTCGGVVFRYRSAIERLCWDASRETESSTHHCKTGGANVISTRTVAFHPFHEPSLCLNASIRTYSTLYASASMRTVVSISRAIPVP
eukprot:190223-Pyramimonas_sp.AAC.2